MRQVLNDVPPSIRQRLQAPLDGLRTFNAGIARMRTLEEQVGSAGRYAYEFRLQREPEAKQSSAWLDRFAARAREHGIDPEAVCAALGGRPTPEPWSEAARAWIRS